MLLQIMKKIGKILVHIEIANLIECVLNDPSKKS